MSTPQVAAIRRQTARKLLLHGFTPRLIAEQVGVSYRTVLKYMKREEEGWEVPENTKTTRIDAQAQCVKLYVKLGFSEAKIARAMNFSAQWVNNLRHRITTAATMPVVGVELIKPIYSTDGKYVSEGQYLVYELNEKEVFLKEKQGKKVFRVEVESLLLKVRMPTQ